MKNRIIALLVAALLVSAGLVACNNDQACAKPGGGSGSSGSRSSGTGYRAPQRSTTQQKPATKNTTKSKPKVHVDDDWFEGDDSEDEGCDD